MPCTCVTSGETCRHSQKTDQGRAAQHVREPRERPDAEQERRGPHPRAREPTERERRRRPGVERGEGAAAVRDLVALVRQDDGGRRSDRGHAERVEQLLRSGRGRRDETRVAGERLGQRQQEEEEGDRQREPPRLPHAEQQQARAGRDERQADDAEVQRVDPGVEDDEREPGHQRRESPCRALGRGVRILAQGDAGETEGEERNEEAVAFPPDAFGVPGIELDERRSGGERGERCEEGDARAVARGARRHGARRARAPRHSPEQEEPDPGDPSTEEGRQEAPSARGERRDREEDADEERTATSAARPEAGTDGREIEAACSDIGSP